MTYTLSFTLRSSVKDSVYVKEAAVLDDDLAEIIGRLRTYGADDADVEAKRAERKLPKGVRSTLSAFANTAGGVLILGLDEEAGFAASGVANAAKMEADLASLCSTDFEPPLRPRIRTHRFEGADLVVAEVPEVEPNRKPCYHVGSGISQGSYIRVADGDRKLTGYEIQMLLAKREQPRDDEQPVPGVGPEHLDAALVEAFVSKARQRRIHAFTGLDTDAVLRRAKIIIGDEISLAGLLSLGSYPQEHFPQLMLTFVHYPRTDGPDVVDGTRFIDNVSVEGPIPVMVRDALVALHRNMSRRSTVRGAGRTDTWEYPEAALREAIVNALVHRDLSPASRGTQVQVEMYPDRMVIQNPGGLFGPITEDDLGVEGISSARNATLLKILEDVPIPDTDRTVCENRGSGIRTMLAALRVARMSPPRFADRIATFTATFPSHTLLGAEVVEWITSLSEPKLTDRQCHGLAMLYHGETLNNQSYRNANDIDSRVATEELGDLVARGLVVQTGGRRWAQYRLAAEVAATIGTAEAGTTKRQGVPRQRADRRAELLAAFGGRELTRAELVDKTGLSTRVVTYWLDALRKDGLVEPTERKIRSRYVRYRRTPLQTLYEDSDQPAAT